MGMLWHAAQAEPVHRGLGNGVGVGFRNGNWRMNMKTNQLRAMLLATGLAMGAVVVGCEEKKAEPAKAIGDAAAKTGEAMKDAAAKTGEAVKDAAAKTGEAAKDAGNAAAEKAKEMTEPAAAPAPAPAAAPAAPDMAAAAMAKIDAGMKTARTTLDELKKKADAANPLVKTAAATILTEAETKYTALEGQVKALTGTDGAAREKAIGEVTTGLGKLNELLASAKSKLGM